MSTGFAFSPQPNDCVSGCCQPCAAYASIYLCCPWSDLPEPDTDEPGGPFPVFFVLNLILSSGACGHWEGTDFIVDVAGNVQLTSTQTGFNPYSYKINATTYTNDSGFKAVIEGDVISTFTAHNTHGDVDCIVKIVNYGLWNGGDFGLETVPRSTHVCYGVTYTGTAPDITSTVDCSEEIPCMESFGANAATPPSILQLAVNLAKAAVKHVADGLQKRNKTEIKALHAICAGIGINPANGKQRVKCGYYDPKNKICMHGACGCTLDDVGETYLNKLAWRSEKCPVGKW